MKSISKIPEPRSLSNYRRKKGANYEGYRNKNDLRKNLVKEQRGICCYCMSTITSGDGRMKIEHWQPQSTFPGKQLDYINLLGSCMGNHLQPEKFQHCDAHKKNHPLSVNPANSYKKIERLLQFEGSGLIKSSNKVLDWELNNVLNLNTAVLVNRRKGVLSAFQSLLANQRRLSRADWKRLLSKWDGSNVGFLEPFCQVVVYYIEKKLTKNNL